MHSKLLEREASMNFMFISCALCVEALSMPMKIILALQLHLVRRSGGGPRGVCFRKTGTGGAAWLTSHNLISRWMFLKIQPV